MNKIFLIRHGQTTLNKEMKFQGRNNSPLNEKGRKHALDYAQYFKDIDLNGIYLSPSLRVQDTWKIMKNALVTDIPEIIEESLVEKSFGDFEGINMFEAQKNNPGFFAIETKNSYNRYHTQFPNGESDDDVFKRLAPFVAELIKHLSSKDSQHILIVSHGVTNNMLRSLLLNEDPLKYTEYRQSHGQIFEISYLDNGVKNERLINLYK